jgi:hypothetical protein
MATNFCHRELVRIVSKQGNQLDRLYAEKARELAAQLKKIRVRNSRDIWSGNKRVEAEVEKILMGLDSNVKAMLLQNQLDAVGLSDTCNDAIVRSFLKGKELPEELKAKYYGRSKQAMSAWLTSRGKDLALSSAVWDLDVQAKEQLSFFIKEGLAEGRDAKSLATDLKKFLKEPNRRFRRIRDPKTGKLKLSEPAKLYKPGSGVYRSSYQNALRLSRNEINIAYRESDFQRRQKLDFVVGIRVNLSNAHPRYDICDELVGIYPKKFQFWGWHPNCLCFTTSVLMSERDFIKGVRENNFDHARNISKIPARAQEYLNSNSKQIKGWKSKPYFIQQNFKNTKEGFDLKVGVTR